VNFEEFLGKKKCFGTLVPFFGGLKKMYKCYIEVQPKDPYPQLLNAGRDAWRNRLI